MNNRDAWVEAALATLILGLVASGVALRYQYVEASGWFLIADLVGWGCMAVASTFRRRRRRVRTFRRRRN